jgi:hypothetical protein
MTAHFPGFVQVLQHSLSRVVVPATLDLRNNSRKPYVYIVFTTGRPLCHEVLKSWQKQYVKTIYAYGFHELFRF